jgi:hypothetical protein
MSATFRMGLVAVFCAMLCAIAANATPIDYIFTGVGSGSARGNYIYSIPFDTKERSGNFDHRRNIAHFHGRRDSGTSVSVSCNRRNRLGRVRYDEPASSRSRLSGILPFPAHPTASLSAQYNVKANNESPLAIRTYW